MGGPVLVVLSPEDLSDLDLSELDLDESDLEESDFGSITRLGNVATLTVLEEGYWGTVSFVDFPSLCRSRVPGRLSTRLLPT